MEVIRQKAQNRTGERQRNDTDISAAHKETKQADGSGYDRTDTGRKTIQTVDQIDRIGNTDQPEKREQFYDDRIGNLKGKNMQVRKRQIADKQCHTGTGDLKQKLQLRRKIIDIIQQTAHEDQKAADQDSVQLDICLPENDE